MKKYLVQWRNYNTGESGVSLENEKDIIRRIDLLDCCDEEIIVFDVSSYDKFERLKIHGIWHNPNDPLYIKVTNSNEEIVFSGYGTDH